MKVEKMTAPNTPNNDSTDSSSDYGESGSSETKISISNQTNIQNLDVLKGKVRQYFKTGGIKKRKITAKITKKLSHIRIYLKRYDTEKTAKKIKTAKEKANRDVDKLARFINKNSTKYITEVAKTDLIEDLNDLRID